MNISNNISSIQAHQSMLNTTAGNIANVNSNGFVPNDTKLEDSKGSVVANTRKMDSDGSLKSQTNLAKEIPDQIIAQKATALNATTIKAYNEMLGSLLDMKA